MAHAEMLTIAVASSLYPAMEQQAKHFEKRHHIKVRLVAGSTGLLYNQILQGAPFDLMIAADQRRPAQLMAQGRALRSVLVGHGFVGMMIGSAVIHDPKLITTAAIHRIVIANPDVAPFGLAAKAYLQQQGVWLSLKSKLIYAQNAMQARMMVDQHLVDAGLVPVRLEMDAVASVPYVGVVLTHHSFAQAWLQAITLP